MKLGTTMTGYDSKVFITGGSPRDSHACLTCGVVVAMSGYNNLFPRSSQPSYKPSWCPLSSRVKAYFRLLYENHVVFR